MSSKTRRRPKRAKPAESATATYRRLLPGLLTRERDVASKLASRVDVVAEIAQTLTRQVVVLAEMRASMAGIAAELTREDPARPYELPPSALRISEVDPDGVLYAALTAGDAVAVAEALGKLAGARLACQAVTGGR